MGACLPLEVGFFTLAGGFLELIVDKVRLFLDVARLGAENMAIDEAILTAVGRGSAEATIRFYGWSEPTISLGHFQKYSELNELAERFRGLAVVRRITMIL